VRRLARDVGFVSDRWYTYALGDVLPVGAPRGGV